MELLNLSGGSSQEGPSPKKSDLRFLAGLAVAVLSAVLAGVFTAGMWLITFFAVLLNGSGHGYEVGPKDYAELALIPAVPIAGIWLTRRLAGKPGENDDEIELASASGPARELEVRKILARRRRLRSAVLAAVLVNGILLFFKNPNHYSAVSGLATGVLFMYLIYLAPSLVAWFLIRRWRGQWTLSLALVFSVLFSMAIIVGLAFRLWHEHISSALIQAAALCSLALVCNIGVAVLAWQSLRVYGGNKVSAARLMVCGIASLIYICLLTWLSL